MNGPSATRRRAVRLSGDGLSLAPPSKTDRTTARIRQRLRIVDSGSGRQDAIPVELVRMILLIALAILAITVVLPAILELATGPFG